jgi:hypothetical protein
MVWIRTTFHSVTIQNNNENHNTLSQESSYIFKINVDNDLNGNINNLIIRVHDGPVTIREHHDELSLKMETRMTELPKYRH